MTLHVNTCLKVIRHIYIFTQPNTEIVLDIKTKDVGWPRMTSIQLIKYLKFCHEISLTSDIIVKQQQKQKKQKR